MSDKKISQLTAASIPLTGAEVLPLVQSGVTVKVANNDLRPKQIQSNATSGVLQVAGPTAGTTRVMTTPDANFTAARTDAAQTFTGDQTFTDNTKAGTYSVGVDAANLVGKYAVSTGFSSGGSATGLTYATTGTAIDQGGLNAYFLAGVTGFLRCTDIFCVGDPDGTNGGSIIRFLTNPKTLDAPAVEAFRIDENQNARVSIGNLVIGTAGKGIDFSASTNAAGMTSELLNDYEEGTWTPVIGGEGGESGQSYTAQRGRYTKVGRMVTCTLDVVLATKGTITGEVAVKGLPFTANSSADFSFPSMSVGLWQNFVTSFVYVAGIVINNSTRANLRAATAAATSLSALATADIANNTRVSGTITYFV
jgi:hypothetical protein